MPVICSKHKTIFFRNIFSPILFFSLTSIINKSDIYHALYPENSLPMKTHTSQEIYYFNMPGLKVHKTSHSQMTSEHGAVKSWWTVKSVDMKMNGDMT